MNNTNLSNDFDPANYTENIINQTNKIVFLTGKAGTGKTTLLRKIVSSTHKNTAIVAPTGIAALNAGGVTIHSFFQLPFGCFIPEFESPQSDNYIKHENKTTLKRHFKINSQRISLIRSLELLIIDEVSMLRADLLDAIDWMLKTIRRNNESFGGIQVLFIGDLMQLPPVVKREEWQFLSNYYRGIHFFNARVFDFEKPLYIELEKIHRQDDHVFIELLNNLRNNRITNEDLNLLNKHVNPSISQKEKEGVISLTTHNSKADEMNAQELNLLKGKSYMYDAEITGEFNENQYPLEKMLELKIGAQIMFIKNDISFDKNFVNGKIGFIDSLSEDEVTVSFPNEKKKVSVERYEWANIRYEIDSNTQEIKEKVIGTFVHFPIKLAWAITVHKSQGLTFEKAILDVSESFAPGQAYVAFSRLKSLNGLTLLKPLRFLGLSNDEQILSFSNTKSEQPELKSELERNSLLYLHKKIKEAFEWYELLSEWSNHNVSYKTAGIKTEKSKHKTWAQTILMEIDYTIEPTTKFKNQIDRLFSMENADLQFIYERIDAAYNYFFPILNKILDKLYEKIISLKLVKKTKQYTDELELFSELLLHKILNLKKIKLYSEALSAGRSITKELYKTSEIENYHISKIATIQNIVRNKSANLLDQLDGYNRTPDIKISKKSKEKEVKKSTYEITLDLLHEGKICEEIARERQLSTTTITSHFIQLIKAEKIVLADVMEQTRINEISEMLSDLNLTSLTKVKDEIGNKISWEELKLYQASTII
ncbi:MAG: helix-turn-helix domain-containing protein [Bacteroidota bacterium]